MWPMSTEASPSNPPEVRPEVYDDYDAFLRQGVREYYGRGWKSRKGNFIALVMASGLVMFLGNPTKYLASAPFQIKMAALGLAVMCQFGVFRRFFTSEPGVRPRPLNVVVAGLSLTLWFLVGWAGRAIAFV